MPARRTARAHHRLLPVRARARRDPGPDDVGQHPGRARGCRRDDPRPSLGRPAHHGLAAPGADRGQAPGPLGAIPTEGCSRAEHSRSRAGPTGTRILLVVSGRAVTGPATAAARARVGADNPVTATDLVSPARQGPVKLGVCLREAPCSGTVSTCVATIRLADGPPGIRPARPARPLRPRQGRRDPHPASPGRRAVAPCKDAEAVLGRPGGPGRAGPGAA